MKLVITYFVVLACAFQGHRATAYSPNPTLDELSLLTRYPGMGYNALEANPQGAFYAGGVNPGIKTSWFIFNQTYCPGTTAFYNGRSLQVPDQVVFHATHSCTWENSTNTYSGQTSYKNELSHTVDASGK